jgi:NAD(P)-dependent dehydrogenase (short-subunit alcohol dehydrogenase family)
MWVSPGATDTPGIETLASLIDPGRSGVATFTDYQSTVTPLGRLAHREEVAKAVLFLASGRTRVHLQLVQLLELRK